MRCEESSPVSGQLRMAGFISTGYVSIAKKMSGVM
jgi:hypothetical protein